MAAPPILPSHPTISEDATHHRRAPKPGRSRDRVWKQAVRSKCAKSSRLQMAHPYGLRGSFPAPFDERYHTGAFGHGVVSGGKRGSPSRWASTEWGWVCACARRLRGCPGRRWLYAAAAVIPLWRVFTLAGASVRGAPPNGVGRPACKLFHATQWLWGSGGGPSLSHALVRRGFRRLRQLLLY